MNGTIENWRISNGIKIQNIMSDQSKIEFPFPVFSHDLKIFDI